VSQPIKQNRDEDEQRVLHVPTPQSVENKKVSLRISPTEVAKFSRLSAQMVELSLQQAQREPTLLDTFPAKVNAVSPPLPDTLPAQPKTVSSPLPWPSTVAAPHLPQPRETPRESKIPKYWHNYWPNFRKLVRGNLNRWFAGARVSGSAAVRTLFEHAKSAQKKFVLLSLKGWDRTASRSWTSAGVAALSAVLVVGVIFGVRHYADAPDTPQHGGQNASPVIPATQDISQPRRSSIVDTHRTTAKPHPARSSAAKHASGEHAPGVHAPGEHGIRKIRRKDDDYVAKDTFVSYDSKGKPVR
jgi:hypothetical protein